MINTPEIPTNTTQDLKEDLIKLNQFIRELKTNNENLFKEQPLLDEIVKKQDSIWSKHREEYANKLVKQLKELHNIDLTSEEKNNLIFSNADFPDAAHDMVVTVLSRSLIVQDPKKIIKDLTVINEERKKADAITEGFAEENTEIKTRIEKLLNKVEKTIGLSDTEQESIKQLLGTISTSPESKVPAKVDQEETQKLE